MLRVIVVLIWFSLLVYALLDCAQTDQTRVRNLPKVVWLMLIVLAPFLGAVLWLVSGRPARGAPGHAAWPRGGTPPTQRSRPPTPRGPDDDLEFLRGLDDAFKDDGPEEPPEEPTPGDPPPRTG